MIKIFYFFVPAQRCPGIVFCASVKAMTPFLLGAFTDLFLPGIWNFLLLFNKPVLKVGACN